ITRQLKLKEPLLEFRVFKHGIFTLATALGMVVFAAMIGTNVILPLYMQNMIGFSALKSGLVLLPGAIIMGFSNPITGYIFEDRKSTRLNSSHVSISYAVFCLKTKM